MRAVCGVVIRALNKTRRHQDATNTLNEFRRIRDERQEFIVDKFALSFGSLSAASLGDLESVETYRAESTALGSSGNNKWSPCVKPAVVAASNAGKLDVALSYFDEALAAAGGAVLNSSWCFTVSVLIRELYREKRFKDAIRVYEAYGGGGSALKINTAIWASVSRSYAIVGKMDDAMELYKRGLESEGFTDRENSIFLLIQRLSSSPSNATS